MSARYDYQSNSSSTRSIRTGPGTDNPKLNVYGDLIPGKTAKGGATEADKFVYAANNPNGSWAGDEWRAVYDNDGHAISGWIAKIHQGKTLLNETYVPDMTPPPNPTPEFLPDVSIEIMPGDATNPNVKVIAQVAGFVTLDNQETVTIEFKPKP